MLFYGFDQPKGERSTTLLRYKGEVYGYDGAKAIKGRKRHILVDSLGLLLKVLVTEANGSERVAAAMALAELEEEVSELAVVWVDQGYQGPRFAQAVAEICGAKVEVVKRLAKGFEVLPKRWKVERTFGWLNRQRRLSKASAVSVSRTDYELLPEVSEAMIYASMIRLMLPRLAA